MELSFGEKIKLLRENAELNQSELGVQVNMTQRKISYIENNKYEPNLEDIRAFCRYFNVSADYFYFETLLNLYTNRQSFWYSHSKTENDL